MLTAPTGKARAVMVRAGPPMAAASSPAWKQYRSRGSAARASRTVPAAPTPADRVRLNRTAPRIRAGARAP